MVGEEVLGSKISIKEETILKGIKQLSAKVTEYKNAISEIVKAVEHLNWRMEAKPILEAEVRELTSVGYTIIKRLEKMQKDLKMAQDTFSAADVKLAAGEKLDKGNSSAKGNKNSSDLNKVTDTVLMAASLENEIAQVIGTAPETSDAEDRDKAIKEDYNEIKKNLEDLGIGAICSDAKAVWEGFKKTSPIAAGIIGAVGDMVAGIGEAVYGIYKTKEEIEASFEKSPVVGLKELAARAIIINSLNPMMPGGSDEDFKLLSEVKKGFVENVINGDDYQKSKYISSIALLFVPGSGELKALEVGADVTKVKDVTTAIDEVSKGEKFLSGADKGIKDVDGVEKVGQLENAAGDNIISLGDVRNEKTLEGISEDESFETGARVVNGEYIANLSSIISSIDAKVAALDKSTEGLEDLKPLEKVDGIEGVSNADLGLNTKLEYTPTSGVKLETTPGKTTTVLGTYKSDTKSIVEELGNVKSTDFGPRDGGFNLLNTPDELYKTPNQFWDEYNKPWLDNVIERGDIVKIATEPTPENLYRINWDTGLDELTGFGREFTYLQEHGYVYDESLKEMKLVK